MPRGVLDAVRFFSSALNQIHRSILLGQCLDLIMFFINYRLLYIGLRNRIAQDKIQLTMNVLREFSILAYE